MTGRTASWRDEVQRYATSPPTIVISTAADASVSGVMAKRSSANTVRSAIFPGARLPSWVSRRDTQAGTAVKA